ncbi:MAG: hypothetical protein JW856_01335, partial [Dehalococcoidales bacterium]|nr:hypothetical protein [Dehalococcoidales bacterium]
LGNNNWGQDIGDAVISGVVPAGATVAFPDNYKGTASDAFFYAGIDSGTSDGDVYKITFVPPPGASAASDLNIGINGGLAGVDIAGLSSNGNTILSGCAGTADVYLSNDGGASWTKCTKPPTGQTGTCIIIAPDFATQHKAYAVTKGAESSFSYSGDGGVTWNQLSLIDTKITTIVDLAIPSISDIFMLTFNSEGLKHSLWRTQDSGTTWERILCSGLPGIGNLGLVKTIPQYSASSRTILLAGQKSGSPTIWKSTDNGQSFTSSVAPCDINAWAVADANTWFLGGYDGSKGLVYYTSNGGTSYTITADVGNPSLNSIVLSPNYAQDKTVAAGNNTGQVYLSEDNGAHFRVLGQQLPLSAGSGRINLAFDSRFSENRNIYATTDARVTAASKERLFRFTIGQSIGWQSIYGGLPENATLEQVLVANDGTLYAVNTQAVTAADKKGGIIRSLNPGNSAPTFEVALRGLEDTVILAHLLSVNNRLWSVDNKNTRLMTFNDSLTPAITLFSPYDKTEGLDTSGITLQWIGVNGATEYEWQISDDTGYSGLPGGFTGNTESTSARPTGLLPGMKYHWHVRVSKPFLGRWSESSSFTTVLGGNNTAPQISLPAPGAQTSLNPVFQWGMIAGATRYDLLVAEDAEFEHIVIDRTGENALETNAWQSDINLENDTVYYWKVRGRSANSSSAWSAVSTFITDAAPAPIVESTAPPIVHETVTTETVVQTIVVQPTLLIPETTAPPAQQPVNVNINIPEWVMYGGLGLLGTILITLLVLMINMIIMIRNNRPW